jgi:sugar lactone lactonase YvrE
MNETLKLYRAFLCLAACALASASPAAPRRTITIPAERFFPESIDADRDGTLYVGSAGLGGVWKIGSERAARGRAIFGVKVDRAHGTVWACSNELDDPLPGLPAAKVGSTLGKFNIATGRPIATITLPPHTFCNDIAVAPDGTAYVSDSDSFRIFRVRPGSSVAETWLAPAVLARFGKVDIDGLAIGRDGRLYFNTYEQGAMYRVQLTRAKPRSVERLSTSRPIEHADGMRASADGTLYMVEGGGALTRLEVRGRRVVLHAIGGKFDRPASLALTRNGIWVAETRIEDLFTKPVRTSGPFMLRRVAFDAGPDMKAR